MNWPIDALVTMEADDVSAWLAGQGLPGVAFLFWDPHERRYTSWRAAGQAARRYVLETIGTAVTSRTGLAT